MYERLERRVTWLLALLGVVAAAVWLVSATRFVDGVDLYVFVNHARDMVRGMAPESDTAYRYFPGVYTFWRFSLWCFGSELHVIQCGVTALLAVNALLTGLLSWRLATSAPVGCLGCILYLCIASRCECLSGTAEPLSTIPFLFALLFLSFELPKHRWIRLMMAGIGFGLCVYCKQQAGLLTLGVVAIPVSAVVVSPRWPAIFRSSRDVAVIALVAAVTLLLGILCEGKGLSPLAQGLRMAADYDAHGSWFGNLYHVFRNDESIGLMAAAAAGGIVLAAKSRRTDNDRTLVVVGILSCAGMAALAQFRTRAYYHYFLLTLPCLVTVFVWSAHLFVQRFATSSAVHRCLRAIVVLLAVVPVLRTGERPFDFEAWNPVLTSVSGEKRPWHAAADVQSDLARLRPHVPPQGQILVLPPVRSAVYFLLDGFQSSGYGFGPSGLENVNWDRLQAAVVIESMDDREAANWKAADCDSAMLTLEKRGFMQTRQSGRFSLWERHSTQSAD